MFVTKNLNCYKMGNNGWISIVKVSMGAYRHQGGWVGKLVHQRGKTGVGTPKRADRGVWTPKKADRRWIRK